MKGKSHVSDRYYHQGIPTTACRPGEHDSSTSQMYSSGGEDPAGFRIQYHRFEPGSSLHPLIQTVPHVAFKVDNLDAAIEGEHLLLDPYEPFEGFKVAMIEDDGAPIELIETDLSEEEICGEAKTNSVIYPEAVVPICAQDAISR